MKLDRLVKQSADYLALADVVSVDQARTFDAVTVEDILVMTPNAWHLTEEQRRRARALPDLTVTVSFRVAVFRPAQEVTVRRDRHRRVSGAKIQSCRQDILAEHSIETVTT
jgi:hypothetical protein